MSGTRAGAVAAGLAAGAAAVTTAAVVGGRALARRREPGREAPGELVALPGGGRMHALWRRPPEPGESGEPHGPVVVFENALLSAATEWLWVVEHLGPSVPYLAYDRAGTGWTPRLPGGLGPDAQAHRLRSLLDALELPPPYVLVGHSVGGLLIRSFAARYPEAVAGLVFVDASHPDQFERSRVQREALPAFRQNLRVGAARAAFGDMYGALAVSDVGRLPGGAAEATRRRLSRPGPWAGAAAELRECLRTWNAGARGLTTLSGRPVAVVTAGGTVRGDAVHGRLQEELAGLSPAGEHEVVPDAGHESLVMDRVHARRVADAIVRVRERAAATAGGEGGEQ
ncbi:alpha/beta fold hydrolase [Streptomyces sp. NPDC016309]|uniref:alpha/beta fold hydrolase n=1 Tax=Streptomyces sp. NPDC016309 TaxID=3364965 RepID=UPI0036FB6DED